MKFKVERDVLADAVAWAARSLPSRPPLPVLAGVLMETGPHNITLSSFDYEVSARVEARAEMAESNLRTLLAAARASGREIPVGDTEMEAILGVLKGDQEERERSANA